MVVVIAIGIKTTEKSSVIRPCKLFKQSLNLHFLNQKDKSIGSQLGRGSGLPRRIVGFVHCTEVPGYGGDGRLVVT